MLFHQSPTHRDVMRVLNLAYHNDTVQTAYAINIPRVLSMKS